MSDCPNTKDGYLAFDALSIKQHIKDRLNEAGVFTDQNHEGSYISTVIDIVSYTFNVLMFYLNKTSSDSMFSEAQIYENINRIVKLIDYKPVGYQTSTLSFDASVLGTGETTNAGLYTIPRYSFFQLGGISYSFNEDITFAKTTDGTDEVLTDLSNEKLLYQGKYEEYPTYNATGNNNEVVVMAPGDNINIDHFNVDVYVKHNPSDGGTWEQWSSTPSLYLEDSIAEKYEIRLNENKRYEIKFGNDINGKKLFSGDQVQIYYIKSDGSDGEVGTHVLNGQKLTKYSTNIFNSILSDVVGDEYTFLDSLITLEFDNDNVSTYASDIEDSDSIRENAPGIFKSQYRLVTEGDYSVYIKTNFANLIHDVQIANNWKYLSEQMKYYYDLGVANPNDVSRVLFNQVTFADACNFNNVYITAVPKTVANATNDTPVLSPSQKELVISSMRSEKTLTSELVVLDPVYVAVDLAVTDSIDSVGNTELYVIKDPSSRRDTTSIKNDINNIIVDAFDRKNNGLGNSIDIKTMTSDILDVTGVSKFYTRDKTNPNTRYEGLSLLVWHPVYTKDKTLAINNITLPYFKYSYFNNKDTLVNNIVVQTDTSIYEGVEY